jgi:hypothetical protein
MTTLAIGLAVVLWVIAALHAYWGLGGLWPAADAKTLARTVIGAPGVEVMPSLAACTVVAVVLAAAGLWPLFAGGVLPAIWPKWLMLAGGIGCAVAFLARGLAGYHPAWRRRWPEQPFARLDRQRYAPLCLALGFGFVVLLLKGSN